MLLFSLFCCSFLFADAVEAKTIRIRDPFNHMDTFLEDRTSHHARPDLGKDLTVQAIDISGSNPTTPEEFCMALWQLNSPSVSRTKPCLAYDDHGEVIESFEALVNGAAVSIVPEGLPFVWPVRKIGDVISVPGGPNGTQIELETLSIEPRVFRVRNFITNDEVEATIAYALSTAMEASTVGEIIKGKTGQNLGTVAYDRTSTNTWDTESPRARELQERAFKLLRMPYDEDYSDGFQVLRYKPGQFYNSHVDYFNLKEEGSRQTYDVSSGGANRVATLFLYLSTVEIGGETVFPNAVLDSVEDMSTRARGEELRRQLVENGTIKEGSLEWNLFDTCRRKLNVKPVKGELILFYNVDSRGVLDSKSLHGACPPLSGEKWGANLWVWNGRYDSQTSAECNFENHGQLTVDLFWKNHRGEEDFLRRLAPTDTYRSFTFVGHTFVLRDVVNPQERSWTYTIPDEPPKLVYRIEPGDMGTPSPKSEL